MHRAFSRSADAFHYTYRAEVAAKFKAALEAEASKVKDFISDAEDEALEAMLDAELASGGAAVFHDDFDVGDSGCDEGSAGLPDDKATGGTSPIRAKRRRIDVVSIPEVISSSLKMVLCVRTDLKMGKGKIAAQCCHAAIGCFESASKHVRRSFERGGAAKIVLKAPGLSTIEGIAALARASGLNHYVVRDAGRTQIASGSVTVIGIGPARAEEIDRITGKGGKIPLKLL
jgi:PTH2 family peptidyl-tRNA hydrolase